MKVATVSWSGEIQQNFFLHCVSMRGVNMLKHVELVRREVGRGEIVEKSEVYKASRGY